MRSVSRMCGVFAVVVEVEGRVARGGATAPVGEPVLVVVLVVVMDELGVSVDVGGTVVADDELLPVVSPPVHWSSDGQWWSPWPTGRGPSAESGAARATPTPAPSVNARAAMTTSVGIRTRDRCAGVRWRRTSGLSRGSVRGVSMALMWCPSLLGGTYYVRRSVLHNDTSVTLAFRSKSPQYTCTITKRSQTVDLRHIECGGNHKSHCIAGRAIAIRKRGPIGWQSMTAVIALPTV